MDLITSGFATAVKIEHDLIFCSGLSLSENNAILESSGGYGGTIAADGNPIGVSGPPLLDVGEVQATVSIEPTKSQLFNLVNWLHSRNTSKQLDILSGANSSIVYDECYLQSGSIQSSENSLTTMQLGFAIYKKPLIGTGDIGGMTDKDNSLRPPTIANGDLVPYWETTIEGLPNSDILSWSLSFDQPLTRKYYCDALGKNERPLPKGIFVGPLNLNLSADLLVSKNIVEIQNILQFKGSGIKIKIGGVDLLNLGKFVTATSTPVIADMGGKAIVSVSYRIYELL